MITASRALEALEIAGILSSWTLKRHEYSDNIKYTSPEATGPDLVSLADETYGKRSYLYFKFTSMEVARKAFGIIRAYGGRPSYSWQPDCSGCFSLHVSHFKGYHWWE